MRRIRNAASSIVLCKKGKSMSTVARMYSRFFTHKTKKIVVECEDAVSGRFLLFACAIPQNKKVVRDEDGRILMRVVIYREGYQGVMYENPEKMLEVIAGISLLREGVSGISFIFYDPRKRFSSEAVQLVHTRLFMIWPS